MDPRLFERKETVSSLRQVLDDHLKKHYNKEHPLKVALFGAMADGIGDFVHHFDFYNYYKDQYSKQPIEFKFVSITNSEFKTAEKIYKDKLPKSIFNIKRKAFFLAQKVFDYQFAHSDFIITKCEDMGTDKSKLGYFFDRNAEALKSQNGIINVSLPISQQTAIVLSKVDVGTHIESLCEYHNMNEEERRKYLYQGKNDIPGAYLLYNETLTGLHSPSKGIKINETIRRLSCAEEKERTSILDSLENKGLLKQLLHGQTSADYLQTHSIACGYMQNPEDTERFIATAITNTPKKCIDIFIDPKLISDNTLLQLKTVGISSVEIVDNKGNVLKAAEAKDAKKTVRLIHFPGTSEPDKEKWISLSDSVAASGDTSFSEMISSRKLPYFSKQYKDAILDGMLNELKQKEPKPEELIKYFELQKSKKTYRNYYISLVSLDQIKILEQWQAYCDEIIKNRTVAKFLPTMIDNIVIASIFKIGEEKEIQKLLTEIPDWKIGDTNFIFLAIKANNENALELMMKKDMKKFLALMNDRHPALFNEAAPTQGLTPLFYAIQIKNVKMANKLFTLVKDALEPSYCEKLAEKINELNKEKPSTSPADKKFT